MVSERTCGGDDFDGLNRLADCCDLAVQVATELVPLDDITTHTATSHTQTSAVFFEFENSNQDNVGPGYPDRSRATFPSAQLDRLAQ